MEKLQWLKKFLTKAHNTSLYKLSAVILEKEKAKKKVQNSVMTLQETLLICFSDAGLLPEPALARGSKALEVQQWSHGGVTGGWAEAWGCQGTAGNMCGMPSRGNWCAAGLRVTLQVMMKNACYSIGQVCLEQDQTVFVEMSMRKPILFLQVPQLNINFLILLSPCVRKTWFLAKLAKNFALGLKTQLSGELKHEQ